MASWRSIVKWSAILAALALSACSSGPNLPVIGSVPRFALTAQTGQPFDSAALAGKVWIADFMFTTCPGPCPRMTSQMHEIQTALAGKGIELISFTVDPEHDTPEALSAYAEKFKADTNIWHFLTGTRADLNHLSKDVFKLGFVDGSLEHSTRFTLIDRTGQIRGYYLTSEPDAITRIIEDARALLAAS